MQPRFMDTGVDLFLMHQIITCLDYIHLPASTMKATPSCEYKLLYYEIEEN